MDGDAEILLGRQQAITRAHAQHILARHLEAGGGLRLAVLDWCGARRELDGAWTTRYGWLGLRRYDFPGLGVRLMADCDVPDVELFPQRYQGVSTVRFAAGLEISLFQLSLWGLAGLARAGMLPRPERLAGLLMAMKRRLRFLGSDKGGLYMRLAGIGRDGNALERRIHLIAYRNQGPYVPTIAATIIARKLARGALAERGARPCLGLVGLVEIRAEVADLAIEIRG